MGDGGNVIQAGQDFAAAAFIERARDGKDLGYRCNRLVNIEIGIVRPAIQNVEFPTNVPFVAAPQRPLTNRGRPPSGVPCDLCHRLCTGQNVHARSRNHLQVFESGRRHFEQKPLETKRHTSPQRSAVVSNRRPRGERDCTTVSTTCAQRQENRVIRRRLMLDRLGHGVSAVTLEMDSLHPLAL